MTATQILDALVYQMWSVVKNQIDVTINRTERID